MLYILYYIIYIYFLKHGYIYIYMYYPHIKFVPILIHINYYLIMIFHFACFCNSNKPKPIYTRFFRVFAPWYLLWSLLLQFFFIETSTVKEAGLLHFFAHSPKPLPTTNNSTKALPKNYIYISPHCFFASFSIFLNTVRCTSHVYKGQLPKKVTKGQKIPSFLTPSALYA